MCPPGQRADLQLTSTGALLQTECKIKLEVDPTHSDSFGYLCYRQTWFLFIFTEGAVLYEDQYRSEIGILIEEFGQHRGKNHNNISTKLSRSNWLFS